MDSTALIVWQSLLRASAADRRSGLFSCISKDFCDQLEALAVPEQGLSHPIRPIEEGIFQVHYSWLAPYLRSLTETEVKLFLSALKQEQMEGLKASLLVSSGVPTPSDLGQAYLKKTLFEVIAPQDLLPVELLPQDPLNALLNFSWKELCSLIDLLSMHDLSVEIRHVIETSRLKEIYSLLTKPQEAFLKTLIHKKEPVAFKKMGLLSWNGDRQGLKFMLLQRGINRIAKSLYAKAPSLLWYVSRRLDSDKGQHLIKLCTPLDHPRAAALLQEQVIELMNASKTHNPSVIR